MKVKNYSLILKAKYVGLANPVAFLPFTVAITDPCDAAVMTIDPLILSSLDIDYLIGYPAMTETLESSQITLANIGTQNANYCPAIIFIVLVENTFVSQGLGVVTDYDDRFIHHGDT